MLHAHTDFLRTHGVGVTGVGGGAFHGEVQIDAVRGLFGTAVGDMGIQQLAAAQELFPHIGLAVIGHRLRHILTDHLIGDANSGTGDGFHGLVAEQLHTHGSHCHHQNQYDRQIDQVHLAEQTAIFVNDLHKFLLNMF